MIITESWLRDNMNGGIGVTAKQLRALGLSWPPQKGWLKGILGKEITEKQKTAFERGKKSDSDNTKYDSFKNASFKGISFDVTEILSLAKNLSVTEYKETPLAKYGYLNTKQNICVLCGASLKSVTREDFREDIHLVSVCNNCLDHLEKKTEDNIVTTSSVKKPVIEIEPVHNLTFDDMKLCPIQPRA